MTQQLPSSVTQTGYNTWWIGCSSNFVAVGCSMQQELIASSRDAQSQTSAVVPVRHKLNKLQRSRQCLYVWTSAVVSIHDFPHAALPHRLDSLMLEHHISAYARLLHKAEAPVGSRVSLSGLVCGVSTSCYARQNKQHTRQLGR